MDAPLIVLKELAGNQPPALNGLQSFFAPHVETMVTIWISIWFMTTFALIAIWVQAYLDHRARKD